MNRTVCLAFAAALLCWAPSPESRAGEDAVGAHLRSLEQGRRGAEIRVRLELNWPGRPEQHIVTAPRIEVPEGGALRNGLSRSRFDGQSTHWSHDALVTLPDKPGPWSIGPARVTLKTPGQEDREVAAVAIRTGRPSRVRQLAGQAAGNGIVLGLALWFGWSRFRRLLEQEPKEAPRLAALVMSAREAAQNGNSGASSAELLDALLALRLALQHQGVENGALWTPAEIQDRLDRVKFGGEELPADECLEMLQLLEDAARN